MTSPYAGLLSVRQVEEQQAEIALAEILREMDAVEQDLRRLEAARTAWLDQAEPAPAETMTSIARADAETAARLAAVRARVDAARERLLECQKARKVVEKLHEEAEAAAALLAARRTQRELDELATLTARQEETR